MLKILIFMGLLVPSISIANMSAHEELVVIMDAIDEIDAHTNHPSANKLNTLLKSAADRIDFIDSRLDQSETTHVMVNLGSQVLTTVERNTSTDSQRVIVGSDARETPIFSDKIRYIVTKPYWNVPSELAKSDVIPKLESSPTLLDEYGYEMLEMSTNKEVEFNSDADLRRYRIRQKPGPSNALGDIKFMFDPVPNRAIYLHDTPDKHLFDNDIRRYSSGCIRLEDPDRFGRFLMNGKVPKSNITDRWLKIPKAISVHIVDWPVYVNEKGELVLNDYTGETFVSLSTIESQEINF